MTTRIHRLAAGLLLLGLLFAARGASAAPARRCFPQTGYCIAGRIREYWEQNGGLPIFGYPITPQQQEPVEGRPVQVQWFERNRLELHPENRRPYDVLLGRIGAERMQQTSPTRVAARRALAGDCHVFAETGHAACGEILAAWRANGLEIDGRGGKSESENLALFGLPLSDPQPERGSDGKTYLTQWFERARFELHPENAAPYDVLLGLLGRELSPRASAPPAAAESSGRSASRGPGA